MQVNYHVEKQIHLLDLFVCAISAGIARNIVKTVPFVTIDQSIAMLLVLVMPVITFFFSRELARHTSVLQMRDLLWVAKRSWLVAAVSLFVIVGVGTFFNSWVTFIPLTAAFGFHRFDKLHAYLNESLMGLLIYRFVWYLLAVVAASLLVRSLDWHSQTVAIAIVLCLVIELAITFDKVLTKK